MQGIDKDYVNVTTLACLIGSSVQTIAAWYRWKKLHPEHELAQLLPEYQVFEGHGRTRYWNREDVWKLIEFKQSIPQGRCGIMGDITQKYVRKGGD